MFAKITSVSEGTHFDSIDTVKAQATVENSNSIGTVSYTHLDVYKRQVPSDTDVIFANKNVPWN